MSCEVGVKIVVDGSQRVTPDLARYDSDQQLSPALKALSYNINCSHVCMYVFMSEC